MLTKHAKHCCVQIQLLTIVCTLYPSDVALAVVILGTSVISLPPTIILCCILYCVMKIWNIVVKGGEHYNLCVSTYHLAVSFSL